MGNCHPSKINVNLGFASVDIGLLGVTISHVTLSCSQYLYNITCLKDVVLQGSRDKFSVPAWLLCDI